MVRGGGDLAQDGETREMELCCCQTKIKSLVMSAFVFIRTHFKMLSEALLRVIKKFLERVIVCICI